MKIKRETARILTLAHIPKGQADRFAIIVSQKSQYLCGVNLRKGGVSVQNKRIRRVADVSLSVAILCVFSWIAIPTAPPITMQTLAVFLIALLLPMWEGLLALCVYIALGCFVPVFSGFTTIGALLASAGAG